MNTGRIFKYIGIAAIAYTALGYVSKSIADNIKFAFKSIHFKAFWANLLRGVIVADMEFWVENRNSIEIEVLSFAGDLTFRDQTLTTIQQKLAVTLKTKTRQTFKLSINTNVLETIASLFLALKGKINNRKAIEGGRVKGTLKVKIEGVPVTIPYDEPTTFNILSEA
jgi:LEA14-like dessication related protein